MLHDDDRDGPRFEVIGPNDGDQWERPTTTIVYANDPRVQRVSNDEYQLPDGEGHWTVVLDDDVWNSYDRHGQYYDRASGKATADGAIYAIIGDPQ